MDFNGKLKQSQIDLLSIFVQNENHHKNHLLLPLNPSFRLAIPFNTLPHHEAFDSLVKIFISAQPHTSISTPIPVLTLSSVTLSSFHSKHSTNRRKMMRNLFISSGIVIPFNMECVVSRIFTYFFVFHLVINNISPLFHRWIYSLEP